MGKSPISPAELALQPFTAFDPHGVLLISGTAEQANPMTISWGMFGIMWGKQVMMVMVRPTRHTWQFITEAPDFTVNWLPEGMKAALNLCGTKSGREMDKFAAAGIHAAPGTAVGSPVIAESVLALECRTLYRTDLKPEQFLNPSLLSFYNNDYHGLFFGEIVAAAGDEQYRAR